jgi:hypothetical protein
VDQRTVIGSYRVEYDSSVIKREGRKNLRRRVLQVTLAGVLVGLMLGLATFFVYAMWWIVAIGPQHRLAMPIAIGFAILLGIIGVWSYAFNEIDRVWRTEVKLAPRWTTHLLESGLETEHENGLILHIPWKLMEIKSETEDAWTVQYLETKIVIFRKPMREAGFEDEFLRRVAGGATSTVGV